MAKQTFAVQVTVGAPMVRGYKKASIRKALEQTAKETKKKFKKTTATWSHQPVFETRIKNDSAEVGTNDEQYRRVNDGVAPHPIVPSSGGLMAWQSNFKSKTLPRKIMSRQGGKTGPTDAFARRINNAYITPRNFAEVIQGEMGKEFEKEFEKAMEEQLFTHLARMFAWNGSRVIQKLVRFTGA